MKFAAVFLKYSGMYRLPGFKMISAAFRKKTQPTRTFSEQISFPLPFFVALYCLAGGFLPQKLHAQTAWMPADPETAHFANRLETLSGRLSDSLFTGVQPYSRQAYTEFLLEKNRESRHLYTSQDLITLHRQLALSPEWTPGGASSGKPLFRTFYKTPGDFLYLQHKNTFLSLNPVIGITSMGEKNRQEAFFQQSYGVEARGRIGHGLGFYAHITYNHESAPTHIIAWKNRQDAVPGAGPFKNTGPGAWEYMQVNAHVSVPLLKEYITATAGFGKHVIGDGMRSLFISDFAAGMPYLRINTRVWKLHYQNLYAELIPQYGSQEGHKYLTLHHLSFHATRWLNIGLFEAVVFGRADRYELGYLNPLILYRQTERSLGSPDKVSLGFNFKAIALKRFEFYGQFLLNEFTAKEFFSRKGYWANKWGLQLGAKYFNAFTIKNLDLQAELNLIRPYTYTHRDTITNFTHYNQPLAHPLGAGIREFIGQARYQPHKDLSILVKAGYYQQGIDTGMANYGNDIFKPYDTRDSDYGVKMVHGVKTHCSYLHLALAYRLRANLFIDLGTHLRQYAYDNDLVRTSNIAYFYGGLRLNLTKRSYDFY